MLILEEFLLGFSILSAFLYFLSLLMKTISVAAAFRTLPFSSLSPFSRVVQVVIKQLGESLASENEISKDSEGQFFGPRGNEEENGVIEGKMIVEALEKASVGRASSKNNVFGSPEIVKGATGYDKAEKMKMRKRPTMLVVPEYCPSMEVCRESMKIEDIEFEIEEESYCLASKKGCKASMEDRYQVITSMTGDSKQAFFAVIDGHGGHAAADYVAENLGKNIVKALEKVAEADDHGVEQAIFEGYSVTDKEFLAQGVGSGACTASVFLKDGVLHVANVGDCRVALSRNGTAVRLTNDHHLSREDERSRVESSGGYVDCHNGVWRVLGSLAVSRAIGDLHMKKWIISEPEFANVQLASDCEFLIIASDGLWNKVDEQEAVDIVLKERVSAQSCKKLVDISCSRGNKDDITVMVVNLQNLFANGPQA
ncbi:hypothetical protein Ancab_038478 [Ancistrocladus abbreviatus]